MESIISKKQLNEFKRDGFLKLESCFNKKEIEEKIITAVNIAIGDDGFRSKEVLEIFQQLAKMTPEKYKEQVKNFG